MVVHNLNRDLLMNKIVDSVLKSTRVSQWHPLGRSIFFVYTNIPNRNIGLNQAVHNSSIKANLMVAIGVDK
jgi:hypothetical protein